MQILCETSNTTPSIAMLIFANDYLLLRVAMYLDFESLCVLNQVSKPIRRATHSCIQTVVHIQIAKCLLKSNMEDFLNVLMSCRAVVAGPLLASVITGQPFTMLPLTIYTPSGTARTIASFIQQKGDYRLHFHAGQNPRSRKLGRYIIHLSPFARSIHRFLPNDPQDLRRSVEIIESQNRDAMSVLTGLGNTHLLNFYTGHALYSLYPAWTLNSCTVAQMHVPTGSKLPRKLSAFTARFRNLTEQFSRICSPLSCPNFRRSPFDKHTLRINFSHNDPSIDPQFQWRLRITRTCSNAKCKAGSSRR